MKLRDEWILIAAGCVIYAISMVLIDQIALIPGSFLGIATALHKLLKTPVGAVNLVLNIPIMILCMKIFGRKMLYYTVIIMAATSVLIDLFNRIAPAGVSLPAPILAVAGGVVMGVGAGFLLAAGGTMAGTTALARIINQRVPKLSVGNLLIMMDSLIIMAGCLMIHSFEAVLYSVVYTFVCSKTIDLIYGAVTQRFFY